MRRSLGAAGLGLLFIILILLHFSLRPLLDWRAAVDFLVIGVMLVAVRVRAGPAALVGLVAGLIADALSPSSFGAAAVAMTIVAFGASWLKASFFAENVMLNALFLFSGKLGFDVIFVLLERRLSGAQLFKQVIFWSPMSAAVTALAGLALLVFFRPLIMADADR
jgi:rod shape-determining protein MreD